MASLQRAFAVLMLAMALSSVLAVAARIPPDGPIEQRRGSVDILNRLNVALTVECDSGFKHQRLGSIPVTRVGGFEFNIVDQNYWKCSMSAPASAVSQAVSGTFDLWARNPTFNLTPGDFVYWLVNKDGLYLVPNVNTGITPQDGQLVYRWQ